MPLWTNLTSAIKLPIVLHVLTRTVQFSHMNVDPRMWNHAHVVTLQRQIVASLTSADVEQYSLLRVLPGHVPGLVKWV